MLYRTVWDAQGNARSQQLYSLGNFQIISNQFFCLAKEQILFAGDLNIHVDNLCDSDAIKFADLLESFGLQQHVQGSTHKEGHTLDLIITRCSEIVLAAPLKVDRFISDHASVCCRLIPEKLLTLLRRITWINGSYLGQLKSCWLRRKCRLFRAMWINLFLVMTSEIFFYPQNRIHPLGY